ncbi:Hypothetical predicted protein [Cloeon dipterum]|uniref:Uncharacterized protein n=1 Tax=Cloeon dipterum TaxID=197152 RepID=A0A8S1DZA3_9INSE|nr:Hypothetical predicted protein [Cloeon dipterum]
MDDDTKLALAKERINNLLEQAKDREESVYNKILENIADETQRNLLPYLDPRLQENLLSQLTTQEGGQDEETFQFRLEALALLLTPQTKRIELSGFMSFCPEDLRVEKFIKVLRIISDKAPNLTFLKIVMYSTVEDIAMLEPLFQLKNLHNLTLSYCPIHFSRLKELCRNMKSLQEVDVRILYQCQPIINIIFETKSNDSDDLDDFKSSFSNLKVFLFSVNQGEESLQDTKRFEEQLWRLCVRELPNLQVARRYADRDSFQNYGNMRMMDFPSNISDLRQLFTRPITLGLHLMFPNVTHIDIEFTENSEVREIHSMLKFTKIECLVLHYPPSKEIVDMFLTTYGPNLNLLVINAKPDPITFKFKTIFSLCPKLRQLGLFNVGMNDDWLKIQFFAELEYFDWQPPKKESHETATLSNILSAPKLQSFTMRNEFFKADDLRKVSTLIAEKKILGNLEQLHFDHSSALEIDADYKSDPQFSQFALFFPAFSEFMKNAIAFCANLNDVHVFINFYDEDLVEYIEEKYGTRDVPTEITNLEVFRTLEEKNLNEFLKVCNAYK